MSKFNEYLSLEFEDRGRGPKFDCWGLVRKILAEQFNVQVPDYSDGYQTAFDHDGISNLIDKEAAQWIQVTEPKAGDVVVLRLGGRPWHCGLMISDSKFIHIEADTNVSVEGVGSSAWIRRVGAYYRHRCLV